VKVLNTMENSEIFGVKLRLVSLAKSVVVSYFDIVLLLFVLIDILIMQVPNDVMYLVILFLWWYFSRYHKRDATPTFIVGLGFVILAPFLLAVNFYPAGEKSAIWGYMFLASWFVQILASNQVRT
ncbi:MAG: hypothetical protein KGL95_15960, partial [Patescibacteria group bacterium]|nr:hypothetical protein [Patescibacteria group bacterium]